MNILQTITNKIKKLISNFIAREVQTVIHQISINSKLRRQEWGLDQTICALYLRCPSCHNEKSLEYSLKNLTCSQCGFVADINFGIPCLIKPEELGVRSHLFLNI